MKKLVLLFFVFAFSLSSFSAPLLITPAKKPTISARDVLIPIGTSDKKISLYDLSTISTKDFQTITGKKMKLVEKVSFMIAQKKLRNSINEDGTFNQKRIQKFFFDCESGFHLGGFALGFLLGIIGVLIAYLIKDECKPNRVKWAWIAFAIQAVIGLISLLA
jgi:hypothetical protein